MNRMINGIVYDTENADLLGKTGVYGAFAGDCHIPAQTCLYRGRSSGKYFEVTVFPAEKNFIMKSLTGRWNDSFHFTPLTDEQAKSCARSHGFVVGGLGELGPIAA